MKSTAPGFLVAMPALRDPHFTETVVLMLEHTEERAVGLVINRPFNGSDNAIFEGLQIELHVPTLGEVRTGGPVSTQAGCIIHPPEWTFDDTQHITERLCVSTSREALGALAADGDCPFRLLLGYAGWGAHQLEEEVQQGTWLHVPLNEDILFQTPPDRIYDTVLGLVGISRTDLVSGPLAVH